MFAPLCWVCHSKCCDDRHVDNFIGFVNVVLLCNTFQVISPVCHDPRTVKIVAEMVQTYGHDASGELPVIPQPTFRLQPTHEDSRRTDNSTQSSSNHRSNSFWSRVDSKTTLSTAVQASYESTRTKVASLVLNNIIPPAEFSRYPRVISPQSNTKR